MPPNRRYSVFRLFVSVVLSCLPACLSSQITAQTASQGEIQSQSTGEAVHLTLREAVQLALKQNPRVIAARLEALESKQTDRIARSAFLPKASMTVAEQANRLNLATLIGQEPRPYSIGPYSNAQLGSNFDIPIIDASAWRSYTAQKERTRAAQFDAADMDETIAAVVVYQYLSLQRAKASERAVQSRVDLARALLNLANDQVSQGTGTSTDALRANVELHVEMEALVSAQADTRSYGYGLAEVLGLKDSQRVEASEDLTAHDQNEPDEQNSLAQAFVSRPDLNAAEAISDAAHDDHRAASLERLPEFHFDGFWAESGRSPSMGLPIYTYQAELRIPLFTGGRITAESDRTLLEEKRSQNLVIERRNAITQEVRTALSSLSAARDELQLSTETLRLSTREVVESRDRFEAGITNNIEVITAQTSLAQATDSQIGAMYRLQQAKADLARARGAMVEEYGR